jgi:hypothetical protein
VPRFKKQSNAIPLLSLRAFVACKKGEIYPFINHIPACDKVTFFLYTVFKMNANVGIFPGIMATRNMEMYQEVNGPESEISTF